MSTSYAAIFRYNSTCTLYQVTQNTQDAPGILSDHPTYLSLENRKRQLFKNYQSSLHLCGKMVHILCRKLRSNFTRSPYQVTQTQQNTPALLSWQNWLCSLYFLKKQLCENYQSFFALVYKHVHMLRSRFRSNFTHSPYQVTQNQQKHSRIFELRNLTMFTLLAEETAAREIYQSFSHLCGRGSWSWRWQIDSPANSSGDTFPPARNKSSSRPMLLALPELHIPWPSEIRIQWGARSTSTTTTTTPLNLRFGEPSARRRNERSSHVLPSASASASNAKANRIQCNRNPQLQNRVQRQNQMGNKDCQASKEGKENAWREREREREVPWEVGLGLGPTSMRARGKHLKCCGDQGKFMMWIGKEGE